MPGAQSTITTSTYWPAASSKLRAAARSVGELVGGRDFALEEGQVHIAGDQEETADVVDIGNVAADELRPIERVVAFEHLLDEVVHERQLVVARVRRGSCRAPS